MAGFAEFRPGAALRRVRPVVRPATSADVDAMAQLQSRAGRAAHPEAYGRAIADGERRVLVAELEQDDAPAALVGWSQTYHHTEPRDDAPVGHYLGGVTVDPAWRRRGIALALTDARMEWIGGRAAEAFYVVNPSNLASISLHRRWSFEEVARAPRLTGVEFTGGVGILMRAVLPR